MNQQAQQYRSERGRKEPRPVQKLTKVESAGPLGSQPPRQGHYVVSDPDYKGDVVIFRYYAGSRSLIPLQYLQYEKDGTVVKYLREKGPEFGPTKFSIPLRIILDPMQAIPQLEGDFADYQYVFEDMVSIVRRAYAYALASQVERLCWSATRNS